MLIFGCVTGYNALLLLFHYTVKFAINDISSQEKKMPFINSHLWMPASITKYSVFFSILSETSVSQMKYHEILLRLCHLTVFALTEGQVLVCSLSPAFDMRTLTKKVF